MCFGGDDGPQQPVNPAPYPVAELNVQQSAAPDKPVQEDPSTKQPQQQTVKSTGDTGANFDTIKM